MRPVIHTSNVSLFDEIQTALVQNGKPRKKRGPKNFQFLGFATCGVCGYAITAERHIKKSGLKYIYYLCTHKSKTIKCSENRFLREEVLTEQVKDLSQKVSLPDEWRDKYLARLESEQVDSRQSSDLFAQNLRDSISALKTRTERLTDAYLGEALELGEYQENKNVLMAEKKTLEEKLSDFERKGNHWLELMRNWIIEANQAENLSKQENPSRMRDFLVSIGSNRRLSAGMLSAEFKTPWNFLAEMPAQARASGAGAVNFNANQIWWCLFEKVRTHFEQNP